MAVSVDCFTDTPGNDNEFTFWQQLPTGEFLLMLANGRERYFVSGGYQPVIDLVKSSFAQAVSKQNGSYPERLHGAATAAEEAMAATFPSSTEEWGEEAYSAVFVALLVAGNQVFPVWIGSPQAQLFRGGQCLKATVPHVSVRPNGFIVTNRFLSTGPGKRYAVQVDAPWCISNGDLLAMADARLLSIVDSRHLTEVLSREGAAPAKALVILARQAGCGSGQAALVARVSGIR